MSKSSQKPESDGPSITKAAREFVKNANKSGEYVKAVESDVAAAVIAVQKKISQEVHEEGEKVTTDGNH
jgi:hypothetical protein